MYVALIGNKKLELKAKVILIVGSKNVFILFFLVKFHCWLVKGEVEENPLCSCFLCKAFATTSEFPF